MGETDFRLIVIAPTPYKLRKSGKTLYRSPAYILCSDPDMPVEQVLQIYIHRWEQEVAFREEKSEFGIGDPRVWSKNAVCNVVPFMVWVYSLMHLVAIRAGVSDDLLPRPNWQRGTIGGKVPVTRLIAMLREEMLTQNIVDHKAEVSTLWKGLLEMQPHNMVRSLLNSPLRSTVAWIYAMK